MKRGLKFFLLIIFLSLFPSVSAVECKNIYVSNTDAAHSLDITFVTDGNVDYAGVERQVNNLLDMMRRTSPFNEFINSKINLRYVKTDNVNDLKCCKNNLFLGVHNCNHVATTTVASICPTDEIVVFSASGDQGDACTVGESAAVGIAAPGQDAGVYDTPGGNNMEELSWTILHEMGHSMAFLADEYLYEEAFGEEESDNKKELKDKFDFINFPNCERHPECENGVCVCPKWRNVPGTGCFQGCSFEDWYRDASNDMMFGNDFAKPGPIDTMMFRSSINRYVDYVKEPLSVEIHKKTTDFIVKKFLEKNPDWLTGTVYEPGQEEQVPLRFSQSLIQLNLVGDHSISEEDRKKINNVINEIVKAAIVSLGSGYVVGVSTCNDFKLEGETDPKISLKFKDIRVSYLANDKLQLYIQGDMRLAGTASINAEGTIVGIPTEPNLQQIVRDCKHLLDIDWNTELTDISIIGEIKLENGALGTLKAIPKITQINLPEEDSIKFKLTGSTSILGEFIGEAVDILKSNHFSKSYEFANELNDYTRTWEDEINANLDEFGLSLKASLDELGLEELAGMGKPHGMIADFYMEETGSASNILTKGVEVDASLGSLRLSGPLSMNAPLNYNRAPCVKDLPLNFAPIDYNYFTRKVYKGSEEKFASIKLSQTFTNWFIATLWNDGYFCSQKEIPLADTPSSLPDMSPYSYRKVSYVLTPLSPPYISYESFGEDVNKDGNVDLTYDLVSEGDASILYTLNYGYGQEEKEEKITFNIHYKVPLQLEEPDMSLPIDEYADDPDNDFSSAQSFFKSDRENMQLTINSISCNDDLLCNLVKSPVFEQQFSNLFLLGVKEDVSSHVERALYEIEFNPVRDINLDFGEFGGDYFQPAINLNYGEYIAKISKREIDDKWLTYDFDLELKCNKDTEYCGKPDNAKIRNIQEVFYKDSSDCSTVPYSEQATKGCRCINKPTLDSKACIEALSGISGPMHYYFRVDYGSQYNTAYNFNLISWSPYRKTEGKTYSIYLTSSYKTYERLLNSKYNADADIEFVDKESAINTFSYKPTQIIAFRARTPKGVEQDLNCMDAVIFDRAPDMLTYYANPIYATIKPRLRSDVNDQYIVCAKEYPIPGPTPS